MTPAPAPVTLACLAPVRLAAAVTVTAPSAAPAATQFHSPVRRRAYDTSESCDAGLVTSRWVHDDRTRPRRYYSITDRAAGTGPRAGRSGLASTAAVDSVLGGGGDPGGGRRLGLMAPEEP
jgi:hypothetical protein